MRALKKSFKILKTFCKLNKGFENRLYESGDVTGPEYFKEKRLFSI